MCETYPQAVLLLKYSQSDTEPFMNRLVCILVSAAAFLAAGTALAQKEHVEVSPGVLHGLTGLGLRVEYEGDPEQRAGLTASQLRSEVQLRLHIAGLNILDDGEWQKGNGPSYLYLDVHSMPLTQHAGIPDAYCYTFSLDLMQNVILRHKPSVSTRACTWSEGCSIIVPRDELRRITEMVGSLTLDFIKAVEAANQIQTPEVEAVL
jgi:hypothetical protein